MIANTTLERILTQVAEEQAEAKQKQLGTLDPELFSKHLKLSLGLAGISLITICVLFIAIRAADLEDKQMMLLSFVLLAVSGLFIMSLASAASAVGLAYARNMRATFALQKEREFQELKRRQAELDASEEARKNLEISVALEVATKCIEATINNKNKLDESGDLEILAAYLKMYEAISKGEDEFIEKNNAFLSKGMCVVQRYEATFGSISDWQPLYVQVKNRFRVFSGLQSAT